MSEEMVTITVDGKELQAPKGAMLIEVTDRADIHVPRFCYHEKLTVAANCRMCLVEVEKAPKPLPACATPVMDGMVVHTRSALALDAQKSVMEFLLINHPLDCPICDQGGECELQDIAMGYGNDISRYVEGKRVVFDKNIGPLISTELTRCIHCTRCIRFGQEIAGIQELGMTDRGENARIATYIQQSVTSEMSGNVIDLCPVGALTAKPSRFAARAWEMIQHASIAAHDCVGSNIYIHTLRGEVVRVVPRENEAINEVWISDCDRFSYEGLESSERLTTPMIKVDGEWQQVGWEQALKFASDEIKAVFAEEGGADKFATLVAPGSTLEEQYLVQKLTRALGSNNIDHRLRQSDFSDQDSAPVMPWLGQNIEDIETLDAALLIASNVRKEQPIIAHRLRKAALNNSADISFINMRAFDFRFPVANTIITAQQQLVKTLAGVAAAAFALSGNNTPAALSALLKGVKPGAEHKAIAEQLNKAGHATVILGNQAALHPNFSVLRILAAAIAEQTGSVFGYLTESCNAQGAWLAGAVPHRGPAGDSEVDSGMHAADMAGNLSSALLLNVEPDADVVHSHALMQTLRLANSVVAITAFNSLALQQCASVMLPAAGFAETSGTYVNIEGYWQSFNGAVQPRGEARPAWKILRVLGNMCNVEGFNYLSSEQVRDELRSMCEQIELDNRVNMENTVSFEQSSAAMMRAGEVPIYAVDAVVRRAASLQKTVDAISISATINNRTAEQYDLIDEETVIVKQGDLSAQLDLIVDDAVPDGCCWIPLAVTGNELLGDVFGEVVLEKAHS